MKTFILFGISIVSSNFVADNFFVTSYGPQKLLAIQIFERLLVLTSMKSPVYSYFLLFLSHESMFLLYSSSF